ncbi:MAG: LemA family protein [Gemmatimonadetes bacterium]|nr:LemA family protein [Gemmatimonadota bacterium]
MRPRVGWVPLLLLLAGCGYNRIQALDERVKQTRGNIDTELLRRNDLIPNLVATVQGAAEFEKQTYTQVAQARAGLTGAANRVAAAVKSGADADELSQANSALTDQLRNFINVSVEAYPQLRANQNFVGLQDELTETENRIAVSRQDYNEAVAQYNTFIRQFPQVLTAKVIGAQPAKPFTAPASAATPPRVQFPGSAPSTTP